VIRLALVCAAAVAAVAGCGGGGRAHGHATLWITRDEGKKVLLVRSVPAHETALQALERSAQISTRYGGRFVQSIDGLAGSIASRHDWFYFVNGIEGDRGAAEYRLHEGDLEWWDYRDWGRYGQSVPVVVGAFPEPFLHGYDGKVRPAVVVARAGTPDLDRIARLVHAEKVVGEGINSLPGNPNVLVLVPGRGARFAAEREGGVVTFTFLGDPSRLLHPSFYRYRYRVP
jgi:Domain of unknown function (DUF4430)